MEAYAPNMVDTATLVWAGQELIAARSSGHRRKYVTVPQRLHQLMRESRSVVRVFFEDKIPAALPAVLNRANTAAAGSVPGVTVPNSPALPEKPPTASELQAAGLTLARLRQLDATITPRALVHVGVVRAFADLKLLGVPTFAALLEQVGQPSELRGWLYDATASDQAWRTNFLQPLRFDTETWLTHHDQLWPHDLAALEYCLGANLQSSPRLAQQAIACLPKWITLAHESEWIQQQQLSKEQHAYFMHQAQAAGTARTSSTAVTGNKLLVDSPYY